MATLALGPFLPLFAMGGAAALMVQKGRSTPPDEHQPTEEEIREATQRLDLEHNGANASVFQVLHDKTFLMGGSMKETMQPDHSGGGYRPNPAFNPLEQMNNEHLELTSFDRADTFYSMVTGQGEIRARKRMPVVVTLTPELHHPNDPTKTTSFEAYRHIPNWANEAQVAAMKRMHAARNDYPRSIRAYHDSEFFFRAPGQSFRYE